MKKIIIFSIISLISTSGLAQITLKQKAFIAGNYFAAVIMASEFKKTNCGSSFNIPRKLTDINAIKIEIKSKFPASEQAELNEVLSQKYQSELRNEFYVMWSKVPPDKCNDAKKLFSKLFESAATDWQSVK